MYWLIFIIFVIGFLSTVYHFYPKISAVIKNRIESSNVLELKGKMTEIEDIYKKKKEEEESKSWNDWVNTVNEYLNMPYDFVKKLFYLYGIPLFYKTIDPISKMTQ